MKKKIVSVCISALITCMSIFPFYTNAQNNTNIDVNSRQIVNTETFTKTYIDESYSTPFENLECTVDIYDDNVIKVKVVHHPITNKSSHETKQFGVVSYPPNYYYLSVDTSNSVLHNPNNLMKKEKLMPQETINSLYYYSDIYGLHEEGEIFNITLYPTIEMKTPTTIQIFGHDITITDEEKNGDNDSILKLDANNDGMVDSRDASLVLMIYALNSTGHDIKTIGELKEYMNSCE